MSIKILEGTLDTLELLLFIPATAFLTSSKIRKKFGKIKSSTLYAKLRKLHEENLIEIEKKEMERAGDDKYGYKLSENGIKKLNELKKKAMQILEQEIKKSLLVQKVSKTTKHEEKTLEVNIEDILMEFYEESREIVDSEKVNELQRILKRLLQSYL